MSIATNKKAFFEYDVLEKFEAGIMLSGPEVKSVRSGKVSLPGSHVTIFSDGAYILDMHIGVYEQAGLTAYNPLRKRKLLLNQKEIDRLRQAETQAGQTVIPIAVFLKKGLIKVEIALVRGKKKHDKRDTIKKREQNREVKRALKHYG